MDVKKKMLLLASVAGLIAISGPATVLAEDVLVGGINKCKGMGDCKGASNSCKGQNTCKGQGVIKMDDSIANKIEGAQVQKN